MIGPDVTLPIGARSAPIRERTTLGVIRGGLIVLLVLGLSGMLAELFLLDHTEDPWQRLPIFLIIASLIILGWHAADRGALSLRFLQGAMILLVLSGALGLMLHFKGNITFELEMQPSAIGWPLIWGALKGATPTLAPGVMVQLGLIGLAYTYRHPAFRVAGENGSSARRQAIPRQPVPGRE